MPAGDGRADWRGQHPDHLHLQPSDLDRWSVTAASGRCLWCDRVSVPGLSAFEERDAALFCGRDSAATQVLERMSRQLDRARLLVVSGVSGARKSSLLRAGVLPRMVTPREMVYE